jgi:Fur family ferric uptake transcriptional regulator
VERLTRQRHAVLSAIEESGRSLNANEIHALAQREVATLNLSTVYRQLKTLQGEAQVVRVDLPGQPPRFEALCHAPHAKGKAHHHHHFHCTACDRVFPIHGCPGGIDALVPKGFRIESHDLTLHGRCAACTGAPA